MVYFNISVTLQSWLWLYCGFLLDELLLGGLLLNLRGNSVQILITLARKSTATAVGILLNPVDCYRRERYVALLSEQVLT